MTQGLRPKGMNSYDSIQRAQPESDLFHTIRNHQTPNANPARNLGRPESKDVLVSLQDKLELEAQEKFRRGDYRFASDKMLIIGRIGKYMFLAVMLPTYLCLYGLPRWLLVEAIPKTLNMANEFAKQAAKIVTEISDWIKAQAILIMELLKIQKGDSESKSGEGNIGYKKQFRAFWKTVLFIPRALIKAKHILSEPFIKARKYITSSWNGFWQRIRDFFLKIEKQINQSIKSTLMYMLKPVLTALKNFNKLLIQPGFGRLKVITNQTVESYKKKLISRAIKIKALAQESLKGLTKAFKISKQLILFPFSLIHRVFAPLMQWGKLVIKHPYEGCKQAFKAIASKLGNLQARVSNLTQAGSRILDKQIERIKSAFKKIPVLILKYTPPWVIRWIGHAKRYAKKAAEKAIQVSEWVTAKLIEPLKKQVVILKSLLRQFLRYLLGLLKKGLDLLIAGIKASPQKTYELLVKIVDWSKRAFNYSTYGIRILMAWSKVLWNHGMELVREVAIEISEHIKIFSIKR